MPKFIELMTCVIH